MGKRNSWRDRTFQVREELAEIQPIFCGYIRNNFKNGWAASADFFFKNPKAAILTPLKR